MPRYTVSRMYADPHEPKRVIRTGLTLEEAQAWCQDPETSSTTATSDAAQQHTRLHGEWFDGYDEEA